MRHTSDTSPERLSTQVFSGADVAPQSHDVPSRLTAPQTAKHKALVTAASPVAGS